MIQIARTALGNAWRAWRVGRRNPGLRANYPVIWDYDDLSQIEIGSEVDIGAFSELAVRAKSSLSSTPGRLVIGDRTQIGSGCNIRACGGTISIGRNCLIAQHVSLVAANHEYRAGAVYRDLPWDAARHGVTMGDNVWLGAGVTVLPGARIGDNAIVAAGAVVIENIPANEIWGRIPAEKLKAIR